MSLVHRVWRSLSIPATEFRCDVTLCIGQAFGWTRRQPSLISSSSSSSSYSEDTDPIWMGVLDKYVIELKQTPTDTMYAERYPGNTKQEIIEHTLRDYFHLTSPSPPSLSSLYSHWSSQDPRIASLIPHLSGLRLLRQSPHECLFSFICSSNNHITRITSMLTMLRKKYGTLLCHDGDIAYHAFPTVKQLSCATEGELRSLGFGYRAKYIVESAKLVHSLGGEQYLLSLRTQSRDDVRTALCQLSGVGPKVADCVALFSLDQYDCIPVDTHVLQIARRDYPECVAKMPVAKSLTPVVYTYIGDFFRSRFGRYAGWAHSLLFVGDLPSFAHRFPSHLITHSKGKKKIKVEVEEEEEEEKDGKRKNKKNTKIKGEQMEQQEQKQEHQHEPSEKTKKRKISDKHVKKEIDTEEVETEMKLQHDTAPRKRIKSEPKDDTTPTTITTSTQFPRLTSTFRASKALVHIKHETSTSKATTIATSTTTQYRRVR